MAANSGNSDEHMRSVVLECMGPQMAEMQKQMRDMQAMMARFLEKRPMEEGNGTDDRQPTERGGQDPPARAAQDNDVREVDEEDFYDFADYKKSKAKNPQEGQMGAMAKEIEKLQNMMKEKVGCEDYDFESWALLDEEKLPPRFEMPDIDKFDGLGDPKLHLIQYITMMTPTGLTKVQMVGLFSRSLVGRAARWYHGLDRAVKLDWKQLTAKFLEQYAYNTQLDVTLRDLETTKQRSNETFSEYLMRWREKAAQMQNRPTEKEQVQMVIKGALPTIHNRLHYLPLRTFEDLYESGIKIEDVENERQKRQVGNSSGYQVNHIKAVEVNNVKALRKFSRFQVPLSKVFEKLKHKNLLNSLAPRPLPNPLPKNLNVNAYCLFHQSVGHDTDSCVRLRHEVQDLIDTGKIPDPEKAQPPFCATTTTPQYDPLG